METKGDGSEKSTSVPALNATERRVLGVLVEKALATPEYYPMTLNALVAGCNQKNNREPVTNYDSELAETTLQALEEKQLVSNVLGETGRVPRWRQDLTRRLEVSAVELAVLGELLLRGPQSEGDLRGRASRMRPIADLAALREVLQGLIQRGFVARLSPALTQRGARFTHTLCHERDLQKLRAEEPAGEADDSLAKSESARMVPSLASAAPSVALTERAVDHDTLESIACRLADLERRVRDLEEKGSRA